MDRRHFLARAIGSALAFVSATPRAGAQNAASAEGPPRLVVVLLRGALDGLSAVVPYGDPAYLRARRSIALARPGAQDGVLDLDGRFGLHPALAPLMPLWAARRLAFVQAAGSPDGTRSHFDAQDYMESGTPGRKATTDGWMNRLLTAMHGVEAGQRSPLHGVSVGPVLPRIMQGASPVTTLAQGKGAKRYTLLDRPAVASAFDELYAGDEKMGRIYRESREARREVRHSMEAEEADAHMQAADNGAPLPHGFPEDAARLANLMRGDAKVELAFIALGGWDTHVRQGAAKGLLASRLDPLAKGLAAFAERLGPVFERTVVVVMSEFGRTVRENGNGGTDHGHGNAMWLLGGPVAGGRVHGEWPGLEDAALYQGRDLAITTDFRAVVAQIVERHLGLTDGALERIYPGAPVAPAGLSVVRA